MFPKFLLTLGVYAALLCVVGELVDQNVPEPYMDEIFHIPQAQRYCAGNFTQWDDKITTLPGLYLFSVGLLGTDSARGVKGVRSTVILYISFLSSPASHSLH